MSKTVRNRFAVASASCFVLLAGWSVPVYGQSTPQAVLDKAIKAMGGEEKLSKFNAASWKFKRKGHGPEGVATTTGECFQQGAEQFRCEGEWQFGTMRVAFTQVIDHKQGWIKNRTGKVIAIGNEKDFEDIKANALYLNWVRTLVPLKDTAFKLSPGGELKIDGRQTAGVFVSHRGKQEVMLYFDKETGLLVKSEMPIKVTSGSDEQIGKVLTMETFYSDYQKAAGIRYAARITTKLAGKLRSEEEITQFKPHAKLEESTFAKP